MDYVVFDEDSETDAAASSSGVSGGMLMMPEAPLLSVRKPNPGEVVLQEPYLLGQRRGR